MNVIDKEDSPMKVVSHRIGDLKKLWRNPKVWAAICAAVLGESTAQAQTFSWNNYTGSTPATTIWSNNSNWLTPPVFGQDVTLSFSGSTLQTAGGYMSTNDGTNLANQLVFNLAGSPPTTGNNSSTNAPLLLNTGNLAGNILGLSTSSSSVAPSIMQNGYGQVVIQQNSGAGTLSIEGTNPLLIGGSGIGLLQISSPIASNLISFSGQPNGLRIDYSPSAFRTFYNGAGVVLSGNNTFAGDVTLANGDLTLANSNALGLATNNLVVQPGTHRLRFSFDPVAGTAPTIVNNVVLNDTLTITGADGANPILRGTWTGSGGLLVNVPQSLTLNNQGAMNFTGPLVLESMNVGVPQKATLSLQSSTTGNNGTLGTTDIELLTNSQLTIANTNATVQRLNPAANLTMTRATVAINSGAAINTAESLNSLNSTASMNTITLTPTTTSSANLSFGSWTRQNNATMALTGTGLGGSGNNTTNMIVATDPGGETPGSSTPGSVNLAVLPYLYTNSASSGNLALSLGRWDAGTGKITPLNTATEYGTTNDMTAGNLAAGSNYRIAGATAGGVATLPGNLNINGLVLDTTVTATPPVNISLAGNGTLNLTGPILSGGSSASTASNTVTPSLISVGGLNFGANPGYVHAVADLWITSPIAGSGGLVKSGGGNLSLLGNNTFTGDLTINAGQVTIDSAANLGSPSNTIHLNTGVNGGLAFGPNPRFGPSTSNSLTLANPISVDGSGGEIIAVNGTGSVVLNGQISGTGRFGTQGTVYLNNAANNFVGDINLQNGALVVANDAVLGNAANRIIMGTPATAAIFQPGSSFTTNRDFLIADGSPVIFTNGFDLTINGTLASNQALFTGLGSLRKAGLGDLTLTASNPFAGTLTVGDTPNTVRVSATNATTQLGGTLTLAGANGSLNQAQSVAVNNGAAIILDNTAAINSDRIGTVPVTLDGGTLQLKGNANANVTELIGSVSAGSFASAGKVTISQPSSAGNNLVTTLVSTGLPTATGINSTATTFIRGTNLGATSGDRGVFLVNNAPVQSGGIVIGAVAASSDAGSPTDFVVANPVGSQFSLVPLTTYGSLAAPGPGVNAHQDTSVFTLGGATSLNALRLGTGGGVDLNGNTLTMGTATVNAQAGMILSTGGANAGIVNGTLDFGAQTARVITSSNLNLGSAANPVPLLGGTTAFFDKSGPGTLTIFGSAASTFGASATIANGQVNVSEGTLALGNRTPFGRANTSSGATGVLPFINVAKDATLDLSANVGSPWRFSGLTGGGTVNLGDNQVNTATSSTNFGGSIVGSANSKWVVGLAQSEASGNTFGTSTFMFGDNSNFFGQFEIRRGSIQFASQLAQGHASQLILGDTAANNNISGTATLVLNGSTTTSFNPNIVVPTPIGGTGTNTQSPILLSSTGNMAVNGSVTLNGGRTLFIDGVSNANFGMLTMNGQITGNGVVQLGEAVFGGGSVAFNNAANNYTGGTILNSGTSGQSMFIVGLGADTVLGPGAVTLRANPGLLRADNGARMIANAFSISPASGTNITFGFTGVNDMTLNGPMSVGLSPASPTTYNLILNDISTANATLGGVVSNGASPNATLRLTKNGPGTLILNNANTFTGGVTLNAGVLGLANSSLGSTGPIGTGALTVNGGDLRAVGGSRTINNAVIAGGDFAVDGTNALALTGNMDLNNTATPAQRTVVVNSTQPVTFAGAVSASGAGGAGLTKAGNGTLVLSGVNTYSGPTMINGGTLLVNGSTAAASTVTIGPAVLGGNGSIGGSVVTTGASSIISPGNSPGVLTMAGLNSTAGGAFQFEIHASGGVPVAGTDFDQLVVTGTATMGALGQLQAIAPDLLMPTQTYVIMTRGDGSSGTFAGLGEGDFVSAGSNLFQISYEGLDYSTGTLAPGADGNDIVLTAVPEPATLIMLGGGSLAAVGVWYYRRRQRIKAENAWIS
jgi:autotransporter-associated beta strand protein